VKTPLERYVPLSQRAPRAQAVDDADGDPEDDEDAMGW
jgi:hypothetical protein